MPESDTEFLEELASLPTIAHPDASPDGDEVALYYDGTGRNELHVIDADTGTMTQWSDGEVPRDARWFVRWDADGERVFFHLDEAGNEQNDVYAIDRDGNVEAVVEYEGQNTIQSVGEDGRTLVIGSTKGGQMNLHVHDMETGETERITDYERAVWGGELSPDCERVAYTTNESDDFDNRDVYVASVERSSTGSRPVAGDDADGSNPRNLEIGETGAESMVADWGPDGDRLLVSDNTEDLSRVGVYDLDADEVEWYGDLEYEEGPVAFTDDGDRILAQRTRDAMVVPVVYDVETGEHRELDLPEGVASFGGQGPQGGAPVLGDDRVILSHTTPTDRTRLLVYDLAADEYEVLLDAEYGDLADYEFPDAEYFTFESHGVAGFDPAASRTESDAGLEIGALLYDSGERPSPLIVNPHGGPRAADFRNFDMYTQFLLNRGYSVLKVNYRGSSGRGREFVEMLYDDWGGDEQADIAEGAKLVADEDWIDDERVVVFGGSYGGYSAYMQMLQYPELYAAGIAWIGVTDLPDMYENTMPHFRTELMEKYLGTPEDSPEIYEQRSPTTIADELDAPLLIVHGVNDRRVPVSQARLFREELQDLGYEEGEGGDYEYVELGEEGHASSDIEQKIRMLGILDDFLERRMGTETVEAAE
ncbi:S9 family peptidase [Halobacteriales archaeon QS_8_69_26]|nr:MAG: S9 family peptidase [Halobacteriales archaeon QS_8_69_26]